MENKEVKSIDELTQLQIEEYVRHRASVYGREIWNAAIEKAANSIQEEYYRHASVNVYAAYIRTLKV